MDNSIFDPKKEMQRQIGVEFARSDDDERVMEFSVSSEEPAMQYFGVEVLEHSKRAVDLEFLNSGRAPLLLDHNPREQIGVIKRAYLDGKTRRLRAEVRFSKRSAVREILDDVVDGIRANVSIGYRIDDVKVDEKADEVRVTSWRPYEVSLVSIPADSTVGVGRSASTASELKEEHTMTENIETKTEATETVRHVETSEGLREIRYSERELSERAGKLMAERNLEVGEISALGSIHNMSDKAAEFIRDGRTLAEFTGYVRTHIPADKPLRNDDIGLTQKETRNFSIMRLARALHPQAGSAMREQAAFEFEAVQSAEDMDTSETKSKGTRMPREVLRSWIMPGTSAYETMMSKRDLNTSDDSDLIPTEHRAGSFIDVLRNASAVMRAGPTMLQGLSGNVDIPKKATASAGGWVSAEGGNAAESEATFTTVALTPKDIAVYTDMTRRMRQQSSPDIEQLVRNDIAMAIALGIDLGALEGSGSSGQPTGVLNQTGVNKPTAFASVNPTFAEVVAMETAVADDNALFGNLAYVGRTNMRGALKTTVKDAGSGQFVMENNSMNGYPYIPSNQGTDGNLYFGNWSDVLIGMWGTLDLQLDYSALALSGGLRMIAFQTVDVAVRHAVSFAYNNDT